eukprot:4575946-Alexandrium_andersonii.AAC.1
MPVKAPEASVPRSATEGPSCPRLPPIPRPEQGRLVVWASWSRSLARLLAERLLGAAVVLNL